MKSKIELEKEREISIKLRFPSFESKLYRFVSLLRSLHCCHFSSRANSIQNVNVEILLIGFTEPVVFYVTTSLPLIRFNQFGLFFPSLPSLFWRETISRERSRLLPILQSCHWRDAFDLLVLVSFISNTFLSFPLQPTIWNFNRSSIYMYICN